MAQMSRGTAPRQSAGAGRAGQDIVLIGWTGLEGTQQIIEKKETELSEHFALAFLLSVQERKAGVSAGQELEALPDGGVSFVCRAGEGGIFAALWELAEKAGTGFEVDLKRISIRQETIEICEYFGLNPYRLSSGGTLLAVTDSGERLAAAFAKVGTEASVIGSLIEGKDKIIRNGENIRYLNRPAPDELNKLFTASQ